MHRIVVTGDSATLRWGYQVAAELGAWTFEAPLLYATVLSSNPVVLAQSGLELELRQANRPPARRAVVGMDISDRAITIRLGPAR